MNISKQFCLQEITYQDLQSIDFTAIRKEILAGNAFQIKGLFNSKQCSHLINDLISWKNKTIAQNTNDPYPNDIKNFHLPVLVTEESKQDRPSDELPLDYLENNTLLSLYNYRIGDIYSFEKSKLVSNETINTIKTLLNTYKLISGEDYPHGPSKNNQRNLFIEFSHYSLESDHFDWHTHVKNKQYGQSINMITFFTQNGLDHKDGGLVLKRGEQLLDTTNQVNQGDIVLFSMEMLHRAGRVLPVKHTNSPSAGRWISSLFYY